MVSFSYASTSTMVLSSLWSANGFSIASNQRKTIASVSQSYEKGIPLFMTPPGDGDKDDQREETPMPMIDYHELEQIQMTEEELEQEVKKYKIQTEIDSILNDPDGAPFDLRSELKKVHGGVSPALPADSPEMAIEENLHEIESEMYAAADAKDFDLAQSKKEELGRMHIDDVGSVLQVNSAFYQAFSKKDYDAMEEIWLHDACALCIHPSSPPLVGAKNVLNSWKEMFSGGNDAFQKNKMEPSNIRLSVKGTSAVIMCDEDIYTKRFVRGKKRAGEDSKHRMEFVNKLITTNIFRKVGGKWFMVHHHATWHHESEAAKKALKAQAGGLDATSKSENGMEGSISVEGMLGIPGHEGMGGEKKSASGETKGPVRRIFRGSLSDLLGGGLGDLLGDENGDNDVDGIDEIMGVGGYVLRNDGDSDDDDENDGSKKTPVIDVDPVPSSETKSSQQPKDIIRQNCIKALRKLASGGSISPKQKRMLLTDIIVKSSTGDYSMVEVAYDLLCNESDDEEAGEEDFAEQCKVFASTLPEIQIPLDRQQQ